MYEDRRFAGVALLLLVLGAGMTTTMMMDLWMFLAGYWYHFPVDWHLLGRWFLHAVNGQMLMHGVAQSSVMPYENTVGWLLHYSIGLLYSCAYFCLMYFFLKKRPSLISAILFAWVLMVSPFLIYQPLMGMGLFAQLTPHPWFARYLTFTCHTFFGLGLYVSYEVWPRILNWRCIWFWHKPSIG